MSGFLSKERITAGPGFNRWLVPPAALAVHLCIGQAYAFSVFNEPMTRLIGISEPGQGDWSLATLGWIFSIAIVFLGLSAAIFGSWVERSGPRKTMFTAACCFGGGFIVSALGVWTHQIWLVYLGYGVLGGIGLGLGYISPVGTLIRWFPDRRGMATGMAIMGFGGGALIGSPLAVGLMNFYQTDASVGVAPTFITMGILYFISMCLGAFVVRVPPEGWAPEGYTPPAEQSSMITRHSVHVRDAHKTPQFWFLWIILCFNVTAGIGVLGQAAVMIQETFGGTITAAAAAGFVGLLSLFNMVGRFVWSSTSDYIGRKATYFIFFGLGTALYALVPLFGSGLGSVFLFVLAFGIILSMYGGGFATIPSYLADIFGTKYVGAIHGRLLTAWAVAGVLGPVLVNYIRQFQLDAGVAPANAYNITMFIMAGLLVIGFICNLLVKPVDPKFHMSDDAASEADQKSASESSASRSSNRPAEA
ncbi:OFA family MFS transporter [Rubrobacter indicoceani]|uniref:L-lactate MFS transporter n=1 Tax=Rubrobacter indicoceani TaxID=2051957 RepID=UPI000E5B2F9D